MKGQSGACVLQLASQADANGMNNDDSLAVAPLERRFHEGLCLAAGGDFEQAGRAFWECVVAAPHCDDYIAEFLANLAHHPQAAATGDALPAEALKRSAAKGDWAEVFKRGTELLLDQPRNIAALLALADACAAQGFAGAAACWVRSAVSVGNEDVAVQRWGAAALARLHDYDTAIACWRRVEALDPTDEEAPHAIASLVIARSRQQDGLVSADAASVADKAAGAIHRRWPVYSLAGLTPTAMASGRSLTAIQQLEATIRDRPSIPEPYLRLAELYLEKDRDYDAERLLIKGREATDNDARVVLMCEEVSMVRHARRVQLAQQELAKADNPQTQEALAQAKKERDRSEIEIFRARVKRQGCSAVDHLELGRRLMRAGKLREAGEYFQKAIADGACGAAAALELAQCEADAGDFLQALRYYRRAADIAGPADSKVKPQALQRAAKIAQRLKLPKLAQRYTTFSAVS
jgi:tetratricopeptide (TPR) repeat protein